MATVRRKARSVNMESSASDASRATPTVLGVGSPWGDDVIGWRVADALAAELSARSGALVPFRIEKVDRPGTRLLQAFEGSTAAVLIDASHSGQPPGTVRVLTAEQCAQSQASWSSHGVGVAEALELGAVLGLLPRSLWVVVVEGRRFGPGDVPSAPVLAAVPEAVRAVIALLAPAVTQPDLADSRQTPA